MIIEHALFQLRAGAGPAFADAVSSSRHLLIGFPGCRAAELLPSVDRADAYLLRVHWDTLADHTERFAQSPAAKRFAEAITPYCAAAPEVVHFQAEPDARPRETTTTTSQECVQ